MSCKWSLLSKRSVQGTDWNGRCQLFPCVHSLNFRVHGVRNLYTDLLKTLNNFIKRQTSIVDGGWYCWYECRHSSLIGSMCNACVSKAWHFFVSLRQSTVTLFLLLVRTVQECVILEWCGFTNAQFIKFANFSCVCFFSVFRNFNNATFLKQAFLHTYHKGTREALPLRYTYH